MELRRPPLPFRHATLTIKRVAEGERQQRDQHHGPDLPGAGRVRRRTASPRRLGGRVNRAGLLRMSAASGHSRLPRLGWNVPRLDQRGGGPRYLSPINLT